MKTLPPAALLLFICTACRAADPTIATVRTWGDLLAQPPLTVPTPTLPPAALATGPSEPPLTVRLGIDSTNVAQRGYVLLYCVTTGHDAARIEDEKGHSEPSLGPFAILVENPNHVSQALDKALIGATQQPDHLLGLFMQAVPMREAGRYTVRLQRQIDRRTARTVASVDVVVPQRGSNVDEPNITWSPWVPLPYQPEPNDSADVWIANDINPSSGIALPTCDEFGPIFLEKQPEAPRPLPQLIGPAPDPGCVLTMHDDDLIVTLDRKVGVDYLFAEEHFLTRWWINGKPFLPALHQGSYSSMTGGGAIKNIHAFDFHLAFQPAAIGAKKGDKVGVQLLYCPHGWEYVGGPQMIAMDDEQTSTTDPLPTLAITRLTNRIDFIYSGDPSNPKQ